MIDKLKLILASHQDRLYQTHTWCDETLNRGIRGIERRNYISKSDIQYKNVLDLGCATGAECVWSFEQGANKVYGVDRSLENFNTFKKIAECIGSDRIFPIAYDLKLGVPKINSEIDTLLCFSITHHINYRKIWLDIPSVKVVYVEGGADSNYTEENLSDDIFQAKLIGYIENNSKDIEGKRPLFRLTRRLKIEQWIEQYKFSKSASLCKDAESGSVKVIKQSTVEFRRILPIPANEYISYKLMMLLKEKGVDIDVAKVELGKDVFNQNLAAIEYLGEHSRISNSQKYEYIFPGWLYWFDRWIGRLDESGDTNLLLVGNKIIPVDFAMAYHWACGHEKYYQKIDAFNIRHNQQVVMAADDNVKNTIKSISDHDIKCIVLNSDLDDYIPLTTRIAYYTGLCFRRDNLK